MYTDWSESANWRSTTITHGAFVAMGGQKSVLCFAPGWQLSRTRIDSMHTVNLGVAQLIIGNVLWLPDLNA
jgi:hypothetical protein